MVETKKLGDRLFILLVYALVTLVCTLCLYPMLHVLFASFSDPMRLSMHDGLMLWPDGYSLKGYRVILNNPNIWIGYRNTIYYVLLGTAINMMMTTPGAFILSRKGWPGRKFFMFLFVFTMYFSGGMIPTFLIVRALGLYNTTWALVLPGAIGTWNMIVLRTAFFSIPEALPESAYLDGANDLQILLYIFLPLSKATLAVIILFYAVGHWNSWFPAMLYLRDSRRYPLQLILRDILINNGSGGVVEDAEAQYLKEIVKYSTIIVATVPILCIYPFAQKYFMKGVMLGSVKG